MIKEKRPIQAYSGSLLYQEACRENPRLKQAEDILFNLVLSHPFLAPHVDKRGRGNISLETRVMGVLKAELLDSYSIIMPKAPFYNESIDWRRKCWRRLNDQKADLFGSPGDLDTSHLAETRSELRAVVESGVHIGNFILDYGPGVLKKIGLGFQKRLYDSDISYHSARKNGDFDPDNPKHVFKMIVSMRKMDIDFGDAPHVFKGEHLKLIQEILRP